MIYKEKAGNGARTRDPSLARRCSTTELFPQSFQVGPSFPVKVQCKHTFWRIILCSKFFEQGKKIFSENPMSFRSRMNSILLIEFFDSRYSV